MRFLHFILVIVVLAGIGSSINCRRNTTIVDENEVAKICEAQLKTVGLNPSERVQSVIGPPITLDSLESMGKYLMSPDHPEYSLYRERLGNKLFWRCISAQNGIIIGGFCEILVDASNGEVLYFLDFDANAPIKWNPNS